MLNKIVKYIIIPVIVISIAIFIKFNIEFYSVKNYKTGIEYKEFTLFRDINYKLYKFKPKDIYSYKDIDMYTYDDRIIVINNTTNEAFVCNNENGIPVEMLYEREYFAKILLPYYKEYLTYEEVMADDMPFLPMKNESIEYSYISDDKYVNIKYDCTDNKLEIKKGW